MRTIAFLLLLALPGPAAAEERRFMLSGFDRVRVDGPFEVEVTSGKSPGAVAIGDARAVDGVSVRLTGTTLVISQGVNGWGGDPRSPRTAPSVRVTTPALRGVFVIGGGRVRVDRLRGQRIDLGLTGAGELDIGQAEGDRLFATVLGTGRVRVAGRVLDASFQTSGAGTIEAAELAVNALSVNAQSTGDSAFQARGTARIAALGAGTVSVAGPGKCSVTGVGRVVCGMQPAAAER